MTAHNLFDGGQTSFRSSKKILAASIALALCPAVSVAQSEGAEAKPERQRGANRLIEEVVVMAQKRTENAQDVPIALAAFSADALDAKGIDDPKALAQFTPGMYYGQTVNFAVIYIRGVGSDAFLPDSDPSVATYIDGIYYPFANGQSQSFGAVERVEVLKGPQGTLFGRNSTGGAINIITKDPGEEVEASFQGIYAPRFEDAKVRGYLSVPITEWGAASVSYTKQEADNYYDGVRGDGEGGFEPFPKEEAEGIRYKARISPLESVDVNLAYIKYEQYGVSSTAMPNVAPSAISQSLGITAEKRDHEVAVDVPSYFSLDNEVLYGNIEWRTEWFDMKVLASKQDIVTDNVYDFDGSATPFITFDARGQFADVKTQEIQFLSNESAPSWIEWIVGAFHLNQESGFPLNRLSALGLDLNDGAFLGIPLPQSILDLYNNVGDLISIPDGVSLGLVSKLGTESTAYFAQTTFHINDWLDLTLGGRYQEEDRYVVESSISAANTDGSTTEAIQFDRPRAEDNNFSPKVTIGINPSDDVLLYATYTQGYKSGTFNTVNVYDQPEYVEPEVVTTYELGIKSQWFDRALTFNAAIFQNEIEDLQVQFISLLSGGAVSLENAGGAEIQGLDFDIQWVPMPELNPGLVLALTGSFLDSEYTSYVNGSGYNEGDGLYNFRNGDFTGNRVTRTPEFSGSFGLNQVWAPFEFGEFELNASVYYNDGFYYLAQNSDVSYEEDYYVVDAALSFLHYDTNLRVTAFGKNINDARYTYSQFHTDAGRQDYLAPPATVGLRVNWDY
ncbi:TonB-dependent receptor [Spongiibacter taiwanensis]|uniref:TonB-dependent receptor n=1 Tax=Spongiibacter taiwanensis TaxID=1748242 RepID=UPI0020350A26|nr:TonB-dependent receptor [Spongiibacter taiwanensis]USA42862.1 TonB-dependent receptor [Spongiibacter taiwanensis]